MGLKNWWRGGPDLTKALEIKALRDIPNEIWKLKAVDEMISSEMAGFLSDASNKIFQTTKALDSQVSGQIQEVNRIERLLIQYRSRLDASKVDFSKVEPELMDDVAETIRGLEGSVVAMERQLEQAIGLRGHLLLKRKELGTLSTAIESSPQTLVAQLEFNPEIMEIFPALRHWKQKAEIFIPRQHQISKSVSRYINNDKKFVKEYIMEIFPNKSPGSTQNPYIRNWLANPKNAQKLMELKANRKYMVKLLDLEKGVEFRKSLQGLSSAQIARKLKIAGVAGVGLSGAAAYMTWFDDEAEVVVKQTSNTDTTLDGFRPSGQGSVIVQSTRKALNTINRATGETETKLGTDPERAALDYIRTLIEQKAILDKNLTKWDTVVKSSDDKRAAKAAGEALALYSKNLENQLNDLGKKTGITKRPGRSEEPGIAGNIRGEISREHIKSVQNYLSSKFPTVAPTGNLDNPTIRALKILEREYDRKGNTDRFSAGRLLVRPNERHLIELNDLIKLDERMKSYK